MLVRVCSVSDVREGEGKVVEADGHAIALFNVGGAFHALDNTCPHRGGPLGEGMLDGAVVTCPWHGWRFNVVSGKNAVIPTIQQKTYKVEVKEQDVFVDV